MAVIYTVEQLANAYREAQNTADQNTRKQMLESIVSASANTAGFYEIQMQRFADYYGIVLKKEELTKSIVAIAQTVGISSSNIYGYAAAGLAYVFDALTKKRRTEQIQEAINQIETAKLKVNEAAKIYDLAQRDLNLLKVKAVFTSPVLWLIVFVFIIYFSR